MKIIFKNPLTLRTISYQRYYLMSFARVWSSSWLIGVISQYRILRISWYCAHKVMGRLKGHQKGKGIHTGQYECYRDGKSVRIVIDASDSRELEDSSLVDWCHVYFKSNFWPTQTYPEKVLPIVIGNGLMTERRIKQHRKLRNIEKVNDLIFVAQVYGGIEHCLRCFEAVNKVEGRKLIRAIFPDPETLVGASREYIRELNLARERLDSAGIRCGRGIPCDEFWDELARSKVVFMRAGKHRCISWGMVNCLAVGSVVVMDSRPLPAWPVPLINGKNYVSLDLDRGIGTEAARIEEYSSAKEVIEELIIDKQQRDNISKANCEYFDQYVTTTAVGQYVKNIVDKEFRGMGGE